jgi:hypothetical protein
MLLPICLWVGDNACASRTELPGAETISHATLQKPRLVVN